MTHRFTPGRLREFAKEQRRDMTVAESLLWRELRARRCMGLKFRRQCPIGPYIADFACLEAKVVVELDGPPHHSPAQQVHDRGRDAWLQQHGFVVIRFSNDLFVGGSGELAMNELRGAIRERVAHPSSDPASPGHLLPQGEKERAGRSR